MSDPYAPREVVVEHDGLRHAALDWGGTGETLLVLHANGLCAGFFDPLARRLRDGFRVVGVNLRGHGGSDAPSSRDGFRFAAMAADVVAVLDSLGVEGFSALGESLGGGVGMLVDRLRPGTLRRLVCCEAIAFDPAAQLAAPTGSDGSHARGGSAAMAAAARARRVVWPDRDAARARYASTPPFDVLAPEALDGYLRWGFTDRPDGQVELACAPETEATIYETAVGPDGGGEAFAHLPAMAGRVSVLHGDASDLPPAWFRAQADAVGGELRTISGGHFFLDEDMVRGEAIVREELR